jgi:hypothetical protein
MTAMPQAPSLSAAGVVMSIAESRLRIAQPNPVFTDAVLADIDRIRRTTSGRALFAALRDAGRSVGIEQPDPPTDPPNAWTCLPGRNDRGDTDIVIAYDPIDWPGPHLLGDLPSDVVLFGRLEDALAIATGVDDAAGIGATVSPGMKAYLCERTAIPDPPSRVPR